MVNRSGRFKRIWASRKRFLYRFLNWKKKSVVPTESPEKTSTECLTPPSSEYTNGFVPPIRKRRPHVITRDLLTRCPSDLETIFEGWELITSSSENSYDTDSISLDKSLESVPSLLGAYGDPNDHNILTRYALISGIPMTRDVFDSLQVGEISAINLWYILFAGRKEAWNATAPHWEVSEWDHIEILQNVYTIDCTEDEDFDFLLQIAGKEHERKGEYYTRLRINFPAHHGGHLVILTDQKGAISVEVHGIKITDNQITTCFDSIAHATYDPLGIPGIWPTMARNMAEFVESFELFSKTVYRVKSIKVVASNTPWSYMGSPFPGTSAPRSNVCPIGGLITDLAISPNVTVEDLEYIATICHNLERISVIDVESIDNSCLDGIFVLRILTPRLPKLKFLRWISKPTLQWHFASLVVQDWACMKALKEVVLCHQDGFSIVDERNGREYLKLARRLVTPYAAVSIERHSGLRSENSIVEEVQLFEQILGCGCETRKRILPEMF